MGSSIWRATNPVTVNLFAVSAPCGEVDGEPVGKFTCGVLVVSQKVVLFEMSQLNCCGTSFGSSNCRVTGSVALGFAGEFSCDLLVGDFVGIFVHDLVGGFQIEGVLGGDHHLVRGFQLFGSMVSFAIVIR